MQEAAKNAVRNWFETEMKKVENGTQTSTEARDLVLHTMLGWITHSVSKEKFVIHKNATYKETVEEIRALIEAFDECQFFEKQAKEKPPT